MKRINSVVRSFLVGAAIVLLAGFAVPSVSQAASITFDLTSDHCSGTNGCIPTAGGSAGTVTITDSAANTVTITVNLLSGFQMVSTGFDVDFGFSLAGNPTITYSAFGTNWHPLANPEAATAADANSGLHMDGTGFFEYGLLCGSATVACGPGASNPVPGPFTATISAAGLSTSSFQQNAAGEYFAIDLLGPNGNTGAVDASLTNTNTPEPSTVVLYGLGLVMLIAGQKWRKSREISANLN